ncbi:hypothetical protein F5Y14DRAFT_422025 [Nemania sp. NC0429]|nr:hypothetical protein F5Y14DRAFT_422025 [Nemania sp. NC0429]
MADDEEPPVPLPSAPVIRLAGNVTLQQPLTHRGHGPGLIIILSEDPNIPKEQQGEGDHVADGRNPKILDPLPQKKWAEEGYAVVQLIFRNEEPETEEWDVETAFDKAIDVLTALETCDTKDRFGLIVYGDPKSYALDFPPKLKASYEASEKLKASVSFSTTWGLSSNPGLIHIPGASPLSPLTHPNTKHHYYPTASSAAFVLPSSGTSYSHSAAAISHTRSLSFLRAALGGPTFDLEAIWDEHTAHEFATRSVARTMGTMVDEPYVNHVPVLTGGVGRAELSRFYRDRFIFSNPADAALELVSRTVGVDRVVDEFVFSLTHDRVVDWLLPGIPPTHKHLRIPFVSVVNIRGDRLYHEHIHWDQGTVLAQAGLLPAYMPFPYALPGTGTGTGNGKRLEFRVPVFGTDTAAKFEDAGARESNAAFEFAVREADA